MKKRGHSQAAQPAMRLEDHPGRTSDRRQRWVFWLTILFSLAFLGGGWLINRSQHEQADEIPVHPARVSQVIREEEETIAIGDEFEVTNRKLYFLADVRRGELGGRQVEAIQYIDGIAAINPVAVRRGAHVLISELPPSAEEDAAYVFVEYDRSRVIIGLLLVFFLGLLVFGRRKGLRTILSLIFTLLAIFSVFVPAILAERNIYVTSLFVCLFLVLMTLLLLNGANIKSACAIAGNIGGLAVAGLLALLVNWLARLSGFAGEEVLFLLRGNNRPNLDLVAIIWSGMVIGALGAIMDVAMSVSSAMHELTRQLPRPAQKQLLRAGLRIGGDVLGTMTNTLILAYIGSSLSLVLVLALFQPDLLLLLQTEQITVEILQALVGSIGLLAAIPITAQAAAWLYARTDLYPDLHQLAAKVHRPGNHPGRPVQF